MAIDLSGKNLRILLLTLNGGGKDPSEPVINNFIVPNPVMKGTGEQVSFLEAFELFLFKISLNVIPLNSSFS